MLSFFLFRYVLFCFEENIGMSGFFIKSHKFCFVLINDLKLLNFCFKGRLVEGAGESLEF